MAVIGIELEPDQLVLTRRRDFKWTFENLDDQGLPVDFPAGELFFELDTGGQHNAVQQVQVLGATGGTYTLNINGVNTPAIDYNDVSENPQGMAGDITDALEAAVGVGNVKVHPVTLFPAWTLNFNLNSNKPLTEQLVNTINKAANDFFNTFEQLFGVDVEMTVTDALNFKLKVTSRKSFDEVGVVTFAVDVTANAVKSFFNGFSGLIGAVNTVNVDFYWNRTYEVEFVGALAETVIPPITADVSSLAGASKAINVSVKRPGKPRLTRWDFVIDGPKAVLKVESEEADLIVARTHWQLVFLEDGEPAGGEPIARGLVWVQE
ncbi:minor tail protein [Mycobacterium phage SydNat]|uniref:LtfC/p132/Gp6 beta-sandwich domain-containing protein n=1 Tax=Mycobacterium phage Zolita TaxID=2593355 RepID=A0A514U298_9CAUD|nr:minor tail protein [Mycobacterium phage Zolita]QDK03088.1 hypothetical protein SEA_ZOLITA_2 [Mycobacterium phage Zolita]UVK64224.1 minor tail protein [Mycobacterium phage SydNat]UVK64310.1 hypothetical protein SEA_GHOULBOY_3 [Mycobacterium phage Ghoulboy]